MERVRNDRRWISRAAVRVGVDQAFFLRGGMLESAPLAGLPERPDR